MKRIALLIYLASVTWPSLQDPHKPPVYCWPCSDKVCRDGCHRRDGGPSAMRMQGILARPRTPYPHG